MSYYVQPIVNTTSCVSTTYTPVISVPSICVSPNILSGLSLAPAVHQVDPTITWLQNELARLTMDLLTKEATIRAMKVTPPSVQALDPVQPASTEAKTKRTIPIRALQNKKQNIGLFTLF